MDVKAPPLPEIGPAEVRQATRAFNEMQDRIRRFVEDRTQMVAAISHDLGTPITRLRLRAEFVEDQDQRNKMLADLDDMEKMVFSALAFARDEAAGEPRAMVDLRTLLQRVCDDLADAGHAVELAATEKAVPYECRPVALRRALANLVENAVNYGQRARVSLDSREDGVLIRIDDQGPGIPEELHEEVFKPFRRLETSRSRETGGTGLGLTVARTIIRAHGGDVTVRNREDGGLRVEVRLPR
jgi:signal transduction histidine kinase